MSNAELSGGAAVRLSVGLGRGGAVNDEHEKNPTLGTPVIFQTLDRIIVPEPVTVSLCGAYVLYLCQIKGDDIKYKLRHGDLFC